MKLTVTIAKKIIIIIIIPFLAYIWIAFSLLKSELNDYTIILDMNRNIVLLENLSQVILEIQRERGKSNSFLAGGMDRTEIKAQRLMTDEKVIALRSVLSSKALAGPRGEIESNLKLIEQLRSAVDGRGLPALAVFKGYSAIIDHFLAVFKAVGALPTTKGLGKKLTSITVLEQAKESAAQFRGFCSGLLARNTALSDEEFFLVNRYMHGISANLESNSLLVSGETESALKKIQASDAWERNKRTLLAIQRNLSRGNFSIRGADFFSSASRVVDGIQQALDGEKDRLKAQLASMTREFKRQVFFSIALFVLVFGLIVLISYFILRSIIKPVKQVTGILKEISQKKGDLTRKIPVRSGDEIGELSRYFNNFIESLREIIGQVVASNAQIVRAASEVSQGNQDMADRVESQSSSLEQTANAIEKMTANIKNTADNAINAQKLAGKVRDSAVEGEEVLMRAVESIQKTTEQAGTIKDIINIIEGITLQTNILALNATVEAARAKSNGKGFAVVANEVRNLALETAENAKQITVVIENLLQGIDEGNRLTLNTQNKFEEIKEKIETAVEKINEVAVAAEEQSQGVDRITQAVDQLDTITHANAALVDQLAFSGEELKNQSHKVLDQLRFFKLDAHDDSIARTE